MFEILGSLLALAIGAGFVGALSGLGGGVFIVPALVIAAHMPMNVAVGASLISVVATSAGASVAFVRDGWTNLKVAMVLECATVTGAVIGAYLAGVIPARILELLFALMMLQSAYFILTKQGDDLIEHGDAARQAAGPDGRSSGRERQADPLRSHPLPGGAALMVVAGLMSGLLGIGSGALKVMAMDYFMHLPLKISSATSNFMIGVTAGAGALVFLARGDVATVGRSAGRTGRHRRVRWPGSRLLPHANVKWLRHGIRGDPGADRNRDGLARPFRESDDVDITSR